MSRLSKEDIMAALEAAGVEYSPEATYGTLAMQLREVQSMQENVEEEVTEEVPERLTHESVSEEKVKVPVSVVSEDYLRKYQYRKQTEFGSKESDPVPGSKAEKMKKHLLAQPKVKFMIARKSGESKAVPMSVCLNGYRLDFPKQQMIDLPEQIVEILSESLNIEEAAKSVNLIDGDKGKEAALL